MKNLILAFAILTSAVASAEYVGSYPDEMVPWMTCVQEHRIPDHTYSLTAFTGGISGTLNTVELHESTIAGDVAKTFVVKKIVSTRPGAPMVLTNSTFSLTVNFTVSPRPDHKTVGYLRFSQMGPVTTMLCEPIVRTM
jgi:hypothetical protein